MSINQQIIKNKIATEIKKRSNKEVTGRLKHVNQEVEALNKQIEENDKKRQETLKNLDEKYNQAANEYGPHQQAEKNKLSNDYKNNQFIS